MAIKHLYVHIPFCDHICFYCDFFKIKKSQDLMVDEYLTSLASEFERIKPQLTGLTTIYLGGGTPNSLNNTQLTRLLEILRGINQDNLQEYTIELNPERITKEQLLILQKYHVNRLSIGIQTFNDQLLAKLNRKHTVQQAIDSYYLARELGFDNISFDLMYNLFDQSYQQISNDLAMVNQLQPDHLSWYSLILKENSYWGKTKTKLPDNDLAFDEIINSALVNFGYHRYEISNYSLTPAKQSQHNLCYWTNKSFLPLGPGASGFLNENNQYLLLENTRRYQGWEQKVTAISLPDYYFQILMMGLRLTAGIDLNTVKDAREAYEYYQEKISAEITKGNLVLIDNQFLKCTPQGYNILNDILVNIMD
ncbi:radical SAM family heme chaperone HemW [Spiroplasma sp. DGKH1]|uniref:radical SAM family heme chaperone HemW n=1 Tax=Spiroplasma sp. DGKH1 TaxID=3050074 RepID=UPI0034C627AA